VLDEAEIELLVRSVDFVAHHWMTERREVNTNLVRATRERSCTDDAKFFSGVCLPSKTFFHAKLRDRSRAVRMNHLLEPDERRLVRALTGEGSIDFRVVPFRPAPDDGEILFRDSMLLHQQAKSSRA